VDYNAFLAEDRRLVILRLLTDASGYKLNASVLQMSLDRLAHSVSRDQVQTDIAWLAEQGLVRREEVGGVVIAHIVARGIDVAAGRAVVPGVKRPAPV